MKLEELSKINSGMTAIICKDKEEMLKVAGILKSGVYNEDPTYFPDRAEEHGCSIWIWQTPKQFTNHSEELLNSWSEEYHADKLSAADFIASNS